MDDNKYLINISDLDPNRKIEYKLNLKPKFAIYLFLVIGALLIIFVRTVPAIIMGAIFMILPLVNLFIVKDRVIFECNDEGCVVYNINNYTEAYKFTWDEVETYSRETTPTSSFEIQILLKDGYTVVIPTSSDKCMNVIHKYIPEKNKMAQWKKEQRNRQAARKAAKQQKKNAK